MLTICGRAIPIASLVTPSTLSVVNRLPASPLTQTVPVPVYDFTSLNFVAGMQSGGKDGYTLDSYCYNGPNQAVSRGGSAVSARGEISPITPSSPNMTYKLDFHGPSLQCDSVEGSDRVAIWNNIIHYYGTIKQNCQSDFGYLSWAPAGKSFQPFVTGTTLEGSTEVSDHLLKLQPSTIGPLDSSTNATVQAALYVALMPNVL